MQGMGRFTQFYQARNTAMILAARIGTTMPREGLAMRLTIEILAASLLMFCISATGATFAADGKPARTGVQAGGLSCAYSVAKSATPTARCAAIRRQCGGKFYANACGDKMLSGV
jgi:hypothetical protein